MKNKPIFSSAWIALAWPAGLMLAPHTLALLGNLAGAHQKYLILWLVLGACVYCLNIQSLDRLSAARLPVSGSPNSLGARLFGLLIFLGGRLITTVIAATALLVTAGFVFNEVFVYWFPNFAFAFILLGILMAIQLFKRPVADACQIVFSAVAAAGLLILTIRGLLGEPAAPVTSTGTGGVSDYRSIFMILWLWIGIDLLYVNTRSGAGASGRRFKTAVAGIVVLTLIFALWAIVSLNYVAAERLADTTIAHTLVAKKVLGQPGRVLIGLVAIAGTCAAVNALFTAAARLVSTHARQKMVPFAHHLSDRRPAVTPLALGGLIAALMAGGVAGTEEIDTFLRAGLLLWMLYYIAVHILVLRLKPDVRFPAIYAFGFRTFAGPLLGATALAAAIAVLTVTDPDRATLIKFLAYVVGAFLLVGLISLKIHRNQKRTTQPVRMNP